MKVFSKRLEKQARELGRVVQICLDLSTKDAHTVTDAIYDELRAEFVARFQSFVQQVKEQAVEKIEFNKLGNDELVDQLIDLVWVDLEDCSQAQMATDVVIDRLQEGRLPKLFRRKR